MSWNNKEVIYHIYIFNPTSGLVAFGVLVG